MSVQEWVRRVPHSHFSYTAEEDETPPDRVALLSRPSWLLGMPYIVVCFLELFYFSPTWTESALVDTTV